MRIALVHNYYQLRGGEDAVFEQEKKLLEQTEQVFTFTLSNRSGLKGLFDFIFSVYNIFVQKQFKAFLKQVKPDVVHIHNWHYATGPIIIQAAKKLGIPVVMTIHNYRLLCPSGTLLHKGELFTDSVKAQFPWTAVMKGVYRDSIIQTFWLAFVVWWNKKIGVWNKVDKFVFLTHFSEQLFVNSSLYVPSSKFVVKPNFTIPVYSPELLTKHSTGFLFVGRLSEEKGISILLEAFSGTNFYLNIVGDGPLREKVIETSKTNTNISYLGTLGSIDVQRLMSESSAIIFPSIWYEPFGLVLIEAFAMGCPVIAAQIGSATELVQNGINGIHFEPNNESDLRIKLESWLKLSESEKIQFRTNALESYQKLYTPKANQEKLLAIYKSVVS
jgi:glycosyltransferase involved in cell wall biosynthesis